MADPAQAIQTCIAEAMGRLLEVNAHLLRLSRPAAQPESRSAEDPQVSLTDEFNPVRIAGEDCYLDLSFPAAAKLFIKLGGIRQVTELVEELANG